jgi:tRNA(His) guanylyltransferase
MADSLGDRIKHYERCWQAGFPPNSPVLIRVDGKAFHTWTRGFDRPFDHHLIDAMVAATRATAKEMQGFKLAYTQSDEATFLICDTDSHEQQGWFGYELNKIISVSASVFTAHFNDIAQSWTHRSQPPLAFFDARAFLVPADDVPNAFIWRQRDWERNSVSMCAHYHFSHSELQGKKNSEMQEMLWTRARLNWAHLDPILKNGTFVLKSGTLLHNKIGYDDLKALIAAATPDTAGAVTSG